MTKHRMYFVSISIFSICGTPSPLWRNLLCQTDCLAEKSGKCFRVGIFLDFAKLISTYAP